MLYPNNKQKLAIYVGERLEREKNNPDDKWHHSFLMLIDESQDRLKILQQIHFFPDKEDNLSSDAMIGISDPEKFPNRFKDVMASHVVGGNQKAIIELWNNALRYAFYLKNENIPFDLEGYKDDLESTNCRAAIIAVLEHIGIKHSDGFYAETAGTRCKAIPSLPKIENSRPSTLRLREVNDSLLHSLGVHEKDRHIGFVPHPFKIIGPC